MEPQEIKVIIYSARNLQPKKSGACNSSVVFGVGKEKYRTETVKNDNNPTWNEEGVIKVGRAAPLAFSVLTDKDETIGTVTVPLAQIPSAVHRRRWLPLKRKGVQDCGDLCFDCWAISFKKQSESTTRWGSVKFRLTPVLQSPRFDKDKKDRRKSIEASSIGLKGSRSIENLYSKPELKPNRGVDDQASTESVKDLLNTHLAKKSAAQNAANLAANLKPRLGPTLGQIMSGSGNPEITGFSPKSGPTSGGTKITIRGSSLASSKEDVLVLNLCNCDLLPTLEYHSPAKIVCTTKPWTGSGPFVLVTKSGGRGTSTANFTFKNDEAETSSKKSNKKIPREELYSEITRLKEEIHELKDENSSLKRYIDKLLVILMEKHPEALCNISQSQTF